VLYAKQVKIKLFSSVYDKLTICVCVCVCYRNAGVRFVDVSLLIMDWWKMLRLTCLRLDGYATTTVTIMMHI